MGILEFIFSSFWVFIGAVILVHAVGRVICLTVGVAIAVARGAPVRSPGINRGQAVEAVRDAISEGALDAAIARANGRNAQRRQV